MIAVYDFQNICGSFYKEGSLAFSPKNNILYSPVFNKIKVLDLENNTTSTLKVETRSNIHHLVISPNNKVLIAVDTKGYAIIVNLITKELMSHFNFKGKVSAIKFSPNGKFLACSIGLKFKIFEAPNILQKFETMRLYKKFKGQHTDIINGLEWSPDSRFLATYSKDLTVRLHNLHFLEFYIPFTFSVHKTIIKCVFFSSDMKYFYTLDKGGNLFIWKWVDDYLSDSYKKF